MCLPSIRALVCLVIGLKESVVVIMMKVEFDNLNVDTMIFFP